jgi:two-component system sensor histidine kinase UhpB
MSRERAAGWRAHGLVRWLLAVPLFYKVLFANSAIVVVGAVAGTAITARVAASGQGHGMDVPLAAGFAVVGLALTGLLNALLLRAALDPLARLQEVARRVRAGDLAVRARPSPLADVEIAQLATTLNSILDEVQRHQEQMRALSGRVIRAQEEERQRIARELHDDTGQVLTLLLIRLKLLEGQPGAEALQEQIAELRGLVAGAIDQVRQLALNLRPPSLDQLGLVPALRSLATTFTANTRIPVALDLPRTAVRLSPEQTIAVYRIAQEALTNAAKHADATTIALAVTLSGETLRLGVRDDGRGFDPEAITRPEGRGSGSGPGVGLFWMEERARLVGGTLRIASAPGGGTLVTLNLPMGMQPKDEAAGERVDDEARAAL